MPVTWMDGTSLSFNTMLLLEQVQLSWLPGSVPEQDLALALRANPVIEWYLRHKCPEISSWLDKILNNVDENTLKDATSVRQAEISVMKAINDWLVYGIDPAVYDSQPFLGWDSSELLNLVDFGGKTVIDVGSGTGRLALAVAPLARVVFAVEPIANLRLYLRQKAHRQDLKNVYCIDGLITSLPFPADFADVTMGGHVFGEYLEEETRELLRVTHPGGMVILCPGNNDCDNETHRFLVEHGFACSRFEEPQDGWKRKYWKQK